MKQITIAIDGFSSTGKSTMAKQLAKHLGYVYVDSGAMYRAVTLYALRQKLIGDSFFEKQELVESLPKIIVAFKYNTTLGFSEVYLNNENVENQIRSMRVSQYVSKIAEVSEVRSKLVEQQQQMGINGGIVMDGRDIGTVVFPQAELKLFITATPEKRAQRRYDELIARGEKVFFNDVLNNVKERDYIDSHREDSPLLKAKDAIEINNTDLTLDEQFLKILKLVNSLK